MEHFNRDLTLTSSETAALLDVHPSTVKRWCNDGELRFDATSGGHRRIHLDDAVEFSRERGIRTVLSPFHPYEPHVWTGLQELRQKESFKSLHQLAMGWIVRGQIRRLGLLFDAMAREPSVSLVHFVDEGIGGLMERVGVAWAEGRLRVAEEHLVSQAMVEVLLRLTRSRDAEAPTDRLPTAVVGTMEGNQHHLGALSVRILLERRGWDVSYLGPDVPVEDFAAIQRSREAALVCISLPPPAAAGDVARVVRVLGDLYDAGRPYALAIGGQFGAEMEPSLMTGAFTRVDTFTSLAAFASGLEAGFAPAAVEAA